MFFLNPDSPNKIELKRKLSVETENTESIRKMLKTSCSRLKDSCKTAIKHIFNEINRFKNKRKFAADINIRIAMIHCRIFDQKSYLLS